MSDVRAFESFFRQAVLRDFHPGPALLHLPAKYRHLSDGEARVVSDHDRGGVLENAVQRRDHLLLLRSVHFLSPVGASGRSGKRRLHLAGPSSAFAGQRNGSTFQSPVPLGLPPRRSGPAGAGSNRLRAFARNRFSPSHAGPFGLSAARAARPQSRTGRPKEPKFLRPPPRGSELPRGILFSLRRGSRARRGRQGPSSRKSPPS